MRDKKLYTRKEFENLRVKYAKAMAQDKKLHRDALKILTGSDRYYWIHQANWLGEPVLNLPQDMFALQEIIFKTRPEFIIELGVAWGGSILFYSMLMEVLGGERVIGVDVYIPDSLKKQLALHGKLSKRLVLIKGSSTEPDTLVKIKSIIGNSRSVMVVLDSHHTHKHVLEELRLYSPLIGKGFYLICGDTIIDDMPEQKYRPRPWKPGNSPKTALNEFFKENDRFKVDKIIGNKLLFTCNPDGYLRCCKK